MGRTATVLSESVADTIISRGVGRKPPFEVADRIRWGQIFFAGAGYKAPKVVGIQEPPTTGWGTVFVIAEHEHLRIFHLWTMKSWVVPTYCYELDSFQAVGYETAFPLDRFKDALPRYYAEHRRRGDATADYETAAKIMEALGIKVPTDEELGDVPPIDRKALVPPAGKAPPPPKKDGSTFKPVKRAGRRGEVLAFFLDGGSSAEAATTKFGISRSNLLSQLYLLNKEHGIGYTVKGDAVAVQLPEGVEEPFA